jgi:hypothetical protein
MTADTCIAMLLLLLRHVLCHATAAAGVAGVDYLLTSSAAPSREVTTTVMPCSASSLAIS